MVHAFERSLTFLFKYPPRVFQRGDFVLSPVIPALWIGLVALGALGLIVVMYSRVRAVSRDSTLSAVKPILMRPGIDSLVKT